ncbi:glycoside hydrolase family 127 protein [Aliifodinibius sp. S!AR15-10]|uniref:aceric acid hydrolase n=1 Tax=Aliifodinibius sp. S!AR15-10 TaxID=2950437 RepID=UPI00285D2992|nr:glycoside hydrolase family 127 protein [Aliifodinibius sp. S!AR15-10]MDR8391931.1 glycoside hydrolase family 127 protein [Aliifodinibius sp. S!AR15-10]
MINRIESIVAVIICLLLSNGAATAQQRALVNTSESPHAKITSLDMDDVQWTDGFWADRFRVARETMVPHMGQLYQDPEISHAFRNFEIAAGLKEGEHEGPTFHDGDFYKWFEGLASVYAVTKEDSLDRAMDHIIEVIAKAQRPDGYIFTALTIARENGDKDAQPLDRDFETYNIGHLMTAAAVHYRATGKRSLLDVAIGATDYLYEVYKNEPLKLVSNAICPSHYMGVAEMYRTTGDPKYLELAKGFIELRNEVEKGTFHNQDHKPFREQTKAVGHAVRANYLYAGVADLYMETGDPTLLEPLQKIWEDVVKTKMYITGATGALYDGVTPDGTTYNPSEIQQVHQAYGNAYELPNITAHNETCANIGNVLWNWRMLLATGEAKYADIMELALHNSVLSGVSLDGLRYCYTNPLRVDRDLPFNLRWSKDREEYISLSNCCPPNLIRIVTEVHNFAYGVSDEGLYVNIYGGNRMSTTLQDGSKLSVTQQTDYPWEGTISLKMEEVPDNEFSFFLRIPGWADKADIKVNGQSIDTKANPGTYAEINRQWSPGDQITLQLPMEVKLLESNPLVEANRNQVAVKRGPIVYSMESVDAPDDESIFNIAIPSDIEFNQVRSKIGSSRVVALEGQARSIPEQEWKGQLYREVSQKEPKPVDVKLVPYYAWGNRGNQTDMTVWMPIIR